jgi:ABC-type bacteriocin/lantibiotic exporter with double-glycine peptidase domain
LARALAAEPDVLVLDEPTSALDLASEAAIQASLSELHGQMTMVIIAHRLSVLSICDRVLVLSKGTVEAFAPADELVQTNAFFRHATAVSRGA